MDAEFGGMKKGINDARRDNKKAADALKKGVAKNELKVVFNDVYKDQVWALYQAVKKTR